MTMQQCLCYRMMDKGSARGARLSWQAVLKEYATVGDRDIQGNIWYFHEAAMESQLCFHSTQPVENTDPSANERYCSPLRIRGVLYR